MEWAVTSLQYGARAIREVGRASGDVNGRQESRGVWMCKEPQGLSPRNLRNRSHMCPVLQAATARRLTSSA